MYDAVGLVQENPLLRPPSPWWQLLTTQMWGEQWYSSLYRPLVTLSFRLEYATLGFGADPRGYVAVNVALHVGVTLAVWLLGRRWIGPGLAPAFAAALFAVHPVATEVVPNIVERASLLATLGVLGALLAWERAGAPGASRWRWLAAGAWGLALLSKETAAALPALVVLRDAALERSVFRGSPSVLLRRLLGRYAPLAVVGVGWAVLRTAVLAPYGPLVVRAVENPLVIEPPGPRLLTAVKVLGLYLRHALVPVGLSLEYGFDQIAIARSMLEPGAFLALAALALAAATIVALWIRQPVVALGLAFFFVALLPVANLIVPIGTLTADRLLYLPLVGLCLAAGAGGLGASRWLGRAAGPGAGRVVAGAGVAAVVALAWLTVARNPVWRTNVALWEHAVETAPRSVRTHHFLAKVLDDRVPESARLADSVRHGERALELLRGLREDFPDVHANLGAYYTKMALRAMPGGRLTPEARDWLDKALAVLEESAALDRLEGRRYAAWQAARTRRPPAPGAPVPVYGHARTQHNLGVVLYTLGRRDDAIRALEHAAAIDPADPDVAYTLGSVLFTAGRVPDAASAFERAVRLRPTHEAALVALGYTRLRLGTPEAAVAALGRALAINPRGVQTRPLLREAFVAWVADRMRAGRPDEARQLAERATATYGIERSTFGGLLAPP